MFLIARGSRIGVRMKDNNSEMRRSFTGLPTTFTALALPVACLAGLHSRDALRAATAVTAAGLAVAMISPVRVPKPGGAWYAVLSAVALGLVATFLARADAFPAP